MRRLIATLAALVAAGALTTVVATAVAGSPKENTKRDADLTPRVLYDCATNRWGGLQHIYSVRVLRVALAEMPADVAEYTGCPDAITRALRRAKGTVSAGIRARHRGRLAAGRVALLDQRGRTVDALWVERGERAHFRVPPGRYTVRADWRRNCSRAVRAAEWRTTVATIACRAKR